MKKSGAMLTAAILAFALAAPAAAQVPAVDGWTGATWTAVVDWLGGWAEGVWQVFGASETDLEDGNTTQINPEHDPNGLQAGPDFPSGQNGFTSDSTGGLDPDG